MSAIVLRTVLICLIRKRSFFMILKYKLKSSDNFVNVASVMKGHFCVSSRLMSKLNKLRLIFLNNESCFLSDTVSKR